MAMAEFISGTEEAFVVQMNERAKGLEMKNTNFINCCGLDADNHYSSAKDVAIMSKELITKYPKIQHTWHPFFCQQNHDNRLSHSCPPHHQRCHQIITGHNCPSCYFFNLTFIILPGRHDRKQYTVN